MRLPYKLVGFDGTMKTKEAREDDMISCVRWKVEFESVPRPSKKLFQLWRDFVEWLLQKKIETIVDFGTEIETIYQISDDRQYIKKKVVDNKSI